MLERMLILLFKAFPYRSYRKCYGLPKDFRFNGYFIRMSGKGQIKVGGNSYISFFSYINVAENTILNIGSNVSIGHNVKIYTSGFDPRLLILKGEKESKNASVTIGDNVLIGSNTYICPGVKIGSNVVIGANSVVSRDVPSNCIAVGAPAVVCKNYD